MIHNLFCCSHFTRTTYLHYDSQLVLVQNQSSYQSISLLKLRFLLLVWLSRQLLQLWFPVHFPCVIWVTCWALTLRTSSSNQFWTHSELICLGQRVCLRDNTSALARDHQSIGTDQHYIIYLIYHTTYQRELETPKNARVRSVFINTATSWENKHSLHRTAAQPKIILYRSTIGDKSPDKLKKINKTIKRWPSELLSRVGTSQGFYVGAAIIGVIATRLIPVLPHSYSLFTVLQMGWLVTFKLPGPGKQKVSEPCEINAK